MGKQIHLEELLRGIPIVETEGEIDREINDFHFDSRQIKHGDLFVAVKGTQVDGHAFIDMAIAKGATTVVCEHFPSDHNQDVCWLLVENSQRELARIAANYYGNPAQKLTMVGVTGTNGKSTSVTLLFNLFNALGLKSGLISTIEYRIGKDVLPATHTTPDAKQLHRLFAQMWEEGCEYCFMEVSSHSLVQHRVTGIPFRLAMFTNITHDHLDFHGSFDEYIRAKKIFFDDLQSDATALINADSKHAKVMVQNTAATVKTFALKRMADYRAKLIENTFEGLLLEVGQHEVWFRMRGSFNAYNLIMVYGAAVELGEEGPEILRRLSAVGGVSGRFEVFSDPTRDITGIVDYAHTPDALENVLKTIEDINQTRGKIITVVGCGGNRDKAKRPKMAKIAVKYSNQVIFTSDNPRNEDPHEILAEMYAGVDVSLRKKVLQIENRREAIRTAVQLAQKADIVLVAGKGHETYQEIKGERFPFDDREVLLESF